MVKVSSETLNDFMAFLEGIDDKRSEDLYEFLGKLDDDGNAQVIY